MYVYGNILLQGAGFISAGSELLLDVLDPGLIGGLLLPVLGALPDSAIILVSGMGGTKEEAEKEVAVGVGTLAGSTILLLSICWGGSLFLGRCDLTGMHQTAQDKTLTKGWHLTQTGVTTDWATMLNAKIMLATSLLYLVVQIPAFLGMTHNAMASLSAAFLCFVSLVAYFVYQVASPQLQKMKMNAARDRLRRKYTISSLVQRSTRYGGMLDALGHVDEHALQSLFNEFDANNDGRIDIQELRALLKGLSLSFQGISSTEDNVSYFMQQFDHDNSRTIDHEEFVTVIRSWIEESKKQVHLTTGDYKNVEWLRNVGEEEEEMLHESLVENEEEKSSNSLTDLLEEEPPSQTKICLSALQQLIFGTCIVAIFADPMVGAVGGFSKASGIPAFFVAFVVTPFASNASEVVSSFYFAAKKRKKNISLTFSQIYGAVAMNNTLCLGLFCLLVHIRGLDWTYSAEVTTILVTTFLVGSFGSSKRTFRLWEACIAILAYPLSIALVILLERYLGWE